MPLRKIKITKFQFSFSILRDGLHDPVSAWLEIARERGARATTTSRALQARGVHQRGGRYYVTVHTTLVNNTTL
ncbi:unnamed protein product [Arctia plantaginis]|uniref:Uncharacterized protein n=1 Tax=Arctia plantaginis TaxID=874455 RepID=A0A8S0ZWY2_ARCPL|nr:unnamed protein product [Arctia plantaginis]